MIMLALRDLSLALLVLATISVGCSALGQEQSFKESIEDLDQPQQQPHQVMLASSGPNSLRTSSRLLAVPHSLARFLFYNTRPGEGRQSANLLTSASGPASSYKRSSSALDALTGVTLGKRSASPLEFVNFEPVFGRQNLARSPPRVYDVRWAPFDSIEAPNTNTDY